jgi:hypothetical protein
MLLEDITWARIRATVNTFRVAVLATIAFLALLMVIVALVAAVFDVSDRGLGVIGIVLTALTGLVGTVVVYLKIDGVEVKADQAAVRADKAAAVSEAVHHDIRNDVLKNKVRQALTEERHMLQNRAAAELMRAQLEERGVPMDPPKPPESES